MVVKAALSKTTFSSQFLGLTEGGCISDQGRALRACPGDTMTKPPELRDGGQSRPFQNHLLESVLRAEPRRMHFRPRSGTPGVPWGYHDETPGVTRWWSKPPFPKPPSRVSS